MIFQLVKFAFAQRGKTGISKCRGIGIVGNVINQSSIGTQTADTAAQFSGYGQSHKTGMLLLQ